MVMEFTKEKFSAISRVDSKGRISIPIGLRAKLMLLEGSKVEIVLDNRKITITPVKNRKKTIGVLGGMGPEASADIYMKMICFCQKKYGAKKDADYPRIIINSIPVPQMIDNITETKKELLDILIDGVKNLESSGSDFIIISCNTVHYFLKTLKKKVNIPILNILEETAKEVRRRRIKKVGLLATSTTINQRLYEKELNKSEIKVILPDEKSQSEIVDIIKRIIAGKKNRRDKIMLRDVIRDLKNRGAEGIILGCTDLPIIVNKDEFDIEIFDSTSILAEAAIDKSFCKTIRGDKNG